MNARNTLWEDLSLKYFILVSHIQEFTEEDRKKLLGRIEYTL